MTNKNPAGPCPSIARSGRVDAGAHRRSAFGLAAGTLMSLWVAGAALPAAGQDAHRLGLCTLDASTVGNIQSDVAGSLGISSGNVEVAFVVVYSLNNDNNGQPLNGAATGPVLCANENVTGEPTPTFADDLIPSDEGTVDIFDSAEAFLLRFEESGSGAPESRFCHTTNANVDCFLLGPTTEIE